MLILRKKKTTLHSGAMFHIVEQPANSSTSKWSQSVLVMRKNTGCKSI